MSWAIRCEEISKLYRLGRSNLTAAEMINAKLRMLGRQLLARRKVDAALQTTPAESHVILDPIQTADAPPLHFWALKDIVLDVKQGDRIGIIGPNGCGKSTLLKILSRITSPTTGQFRFRGRLISLLEIGTGFHGDLTGRENIFLNGSIMGMKPPEIRRRLNEIVEFSELGAMIDTPVKRYSSGMYVRLAFAVAAHLESEILIVDEVLAVGDAAFQRKCSEKMLQVAGQGRTLLFVSHDMDAINRICSRAVYMAHGRIIADSEITAGGARDVGIGGTVSAITRSYIRSGIRFVAERHWDDPDRAPSFENCVRLDAVRLLDESGTPRAEFDVKEEITIEVTFTSLEASRPIYLHLHLKDLAGHYIFVSMDNLAAEGNGFRPPGKYVERCTIPAPLLNSGDYRVDVEFWPGEPREDRIIQNHVVSFSVADDSRPEGVRGNWPNEWPNCLTRPQLRWSVNREELAPQM